MKETTNPASIRKAAWTVPSSSGEAWTFLDEWIHLTMTPADNRNFLQFRVG